MESGILERFNTWWRTGKVREELLPEYRRHLFTDIQKYIALRPAILIYGLRRVGKSTLLYQLVSELLEETKPVNILYFSFDDKRYELDDVLETYQRYVLHNSFDHLREKVYVFLDEIQKIDDWENKVKVVYDLYPKVKFVLSGSASIALRKAATESLAGRIFHFVLDPLNFAEFLEMQGIDTMKIRENPILWQSNMLLLFDKYVKYGAFPELASSDDEEVARKYINENVMEKIIYKDLRESFVIADVNLLKTLADMVARNPGMLVDYASIARDLKKDQRTIANYFEYLEFGMIIRFVFNFRGSSIASRRKLKKVYLQTPNIAFASNENINALLPKMYENSVASATKAKFFYRNSFEVDFVLQKGVSLTGVEVKSSGAEVRQLLKLKEKYGAKVKELLLLTDIPKGNAKGIKIMPIWEYCLFHVHNND